MQQKQYSMMYESEPFHWWFKAKFYFIDSVLTRSSKMLKILDVGCGTGGTTESLGKFGQVTAIEPSTYAHKFLKKRNIIFIPMTFAGYESDKKYDLICFLDVLYHQNMGDEKKAVKKAYSLLKKGGHILITDCAMPILFSHHDKIMQAKKRYYLSEMENIVKGAGFTISKSSYIYFFTFPVFFMLRLIQKFSNFESMVRLPKIINTLFEKIMFFESRLLKKFKFPLGSSIIVYAQK